MYRIVELKKLVLAVARSEAGYSIGLYAKADGGDDVLLASSGDEYRARKEAFRVLRQEINLARDQWPLAQEGGAASSPA